MLEGPFSHDKKFIRFANEQVIHFMYLQGLKKETVTVKVDGETEVRSKFVPQLSPETMDEIGRDMMNWLRHEKAPQTWRCPRVEIWSAGKELLFAHGPGSRFIPAQLITDAVKQAQKKLGPGLSLRDYRKVCEHLKAVDEAIQTRKPAAAAAALKKLTRLKNLTPALQKELNARHKAYEALRVSAANAKASPSSRAEGR